ncbi:hypothetical protein [Labedella phragmitis]|uniref:hypothetical protein n=1 Tax=Labedella phragmitis TaxID=2498849 RepID=UPI001407ADE0|nr:hypothetical protein [Labedella phragmitis]
MDSAVPRRSGSAARRTAAIVAATALSLGAALGTTTAANAAPPAGQITDASFTWGLSGEAGGGAFFGGCNFLSAGTAGNTGSSRLWTEADGFYSTSDGDVTIVKPNAAGELVQPTWTTKCETPQGTPVSAGSTTSLSKNAVVFDGGEGAVAADGSTEIAWTGSFTVAFYGGLTYWTATDPVLSLDAAGNGQLTATASGYGASMEDMTQWVPVSGREIVLADITGAAADEDGFTVTPDYLGRTVTTAGTPQTTTGATWGSFPQSFVDFQQLTGQSSYWYSSGGSRDAAKPTTPLAVSYSLANDPGTDPGTNPGGEEPGEGEQDIDVTVPAAPEPETGSFGWAFTSADAVSLGTAVQVGSTFTADGALNTIAVTDTRSGGAGAYSWSISGSVSEFSSGTADFSAGYLGWSPSVSSAGAGVTAGAPVPSTLSGGAGLGSSATLASSTTAASANIDAGLELVIPSDTPAGDYAATLTVTALG